MDSTAIKNTKKTPTHDSASAHGIMDFKLPVLSVQQKSVPSWRQELEVSLNGLTTVLLLVWICGQQ